MHKYRGGGRLGVHADPQSYLWTVEQVNTRIDEFNESGGSEESQRVDEFLADLSQLQETARLVWFLEDVRINFIKNELYY